MTVITEAEIRASVDVSGLKTYIDMLDKVAEGSLDASDAIAVLEQQVQDYEKELADTKENTLQWIKADEKLKRAKEELNNALADEGKGFKAAKQDAKALEQEQKELERQTKASAKAAEQASKKYHDMAKKAVAVLGQYLAIKKTISAVMGFAAEGEELARMAQLSGTSAESIERLGIALRNYGGSASSASSALGKLNKQMEELKYGKNNKLSQAAIQYGLNINASSPEQLMMNIAKRMEGLSALQQVNLGRMLGLDDATIMFLQQGVAGVQQELSKAGKLTVFSKEDIENTQKMQRAYREFQQQLESVKATITRSLLPVFQVVFERLAKIAEYLKEHPNLLKTVGAVATAVFAGISAALSPITTVLIGIAGIFAVLIDDWVAFKTGGESALTVVWQNLEKIIKYLDGVWERLKNVVTLWGLLSSEDEIKDVEGNMHPILKDVDGNLTYYGKKPNAIEIGQNYVTSADNFPLNSSSAAAASTVTNNKSQNRNYTFNFGSITVEANKPEEFLQKIQEMSLTGLADPAH